MKVFKSNYVSDKKTIKAEVKGIPEPDVFFGGITLRVPFDVIDKLFEIQENNREERGGYVGGRFVNLECREDRIANFFKIIEIENVSEKRKEEYKRNAEDAMEADDDVLDVTNKLFYLFHTHPEGVNPSAEDLKKVTAVEERPHVLVAPGKSLYLYSDRKLPKMYLTWHNWKWVNDDQEKVGETAPEKYPEEAHHVFVKALNISED